MAPGRPLRALHEGVERGIDEVVGVVGNELGRGQDPNTDRLASDLSVNRLLYLLQPVG
jgi:hypothetical protein